MTRTSTPMTRPDTLSLVTSERRCGLAEHTGAPDADSLTDPAPASLLDSPGVRRWHEVVAAADRSRSHTYQLPLDGRPGATSSVHGHEVTLFSCYSYLGLGGHPAVAAAAHHAIDRYGTTTGGARLLTGTLALHLEVEEQLAAFLGVPAAVLFQSGYDANTATLGTLFGPGDTLLVDQYAHRSLHDGARLSGAVVRRWRHNAVDRLEAQLQDLHGSPGRRVVVVDGVYSMEGDVAPLRELVALKRRWGALLVVDESHSTGVLGVTGRGTCQALGVDPVDVDMLTGSLGKAVPSSGGFVAGTRGLATYLRYAAAPSVFSGAGAAASAAAVGAALRIIDDEPEHLARLRENGLRLRSLLRSLGLSVADHPTPVVPLELGDAERTWRWSRILLAHGVSTSAVLHPAVPLGRGRLRLCATAEHRSHHFDQLERGLRACLADEASGG